MVSDKANPIVVGRLGAVYGIKGWLKINSYTDIAEGIFDYTPWLIQQQGKWVEIKVADYKRHNKALIAKLEGIDLREEAQAMTGAEIAVYPEQLPELEEGYYWRDLIGCQVLTEKGYNLGKVTELLETGANDVLVVKANANDAFGKKERLIPFLEEQVIKTIDLATQTIEVDWDPGF